ncbi:unnamed protein product [Diabrotica balteata]|uniref:DUF8207 domain-containing protein n=1 Tax=Diabrotica balteata TaxID=107213 RepID=A0A9N9SZF9_DIABA|nr:unnamed protein product [Diabrotica balteata]
MLNREQRIKQLAKIIGTKYKALKRMQSDQQEHLETIFTPITEPLTEINNFLKTTHQSENHEDTSEHQNNHLNNTQQKDEESSDEEHLQKYWHHSPDIDRSYGPQYVWKTDKWVMGDKEIKFTPKNIWVNNNQYKATNGLYNLIFYKEPQDFTPNDCINYKKILEVTGIHRDSRGYLRHQAFPDKFKKIIKPIFKMNPAKEQKLLLWFDEIDDDVNEDKSESEPYSDDGECSYSENYVPGSSNLLNESVSGSDEILEDHDENPEENGEQILNFIKNRTDGETPGSGVNKLIKVMGPPA